MELSMMVSHVYLF